MNLYIRFFYNILKNLFFLKPITTKDKSIIKMRVLPNDLDLNMHMNNGRYPTIMDIGRTEYTIRLGLHKVIMKEKLGAVAGGVNITFLKPLNLFASYELHTKVISWDNMWFYIEQQFVKNEVIMAHAIAKVTFMKGRKKVSPDYVLSKLNTDIEKLEKPDMPNYLQELIHGEKEMINIVRAHNRNLKK